MNFETRKQVRIRIILIFMFIFSFCTIKGQQTPLSPVSYWVFVPYIYNPAVVGSKDFLSIGANASFQGKSNTQLISGNTRISKTKSGYFSSPDIVEFKNIGIGGSAFRDINGLSRNIGLSVSGSYQIPLNTRKLSFLSIGASVKGVYNTMEYDSTAPAYPLRNTFYPNIDFGVYYFGTNFFTGLSTTNFLGKPKDPDSLGVFRIPVSREYFFTIGYKILLSKSLNIVLEPSVLILANDSTIKNISGKTNNLTDNINPIIKLYLQDFCLGASYRTNGKISVFSQFRYPRFYIGALCEFAKKTPYFKKNPIIELTFGVNIQPDKSRLSKHSHW